MIAIGCDHGGYKLKEQVKEHLSKSNIDCQDFGTDSTESVDYATFAVKVTHAVMENRAELGILICTTGIGICMAANKVKGIRAAACTNTFCAEMTRRHNNANVLCLGAKVVDEKTALEIVDKFLSTGFDGGRHQRRIDQIAQIEDGTLK